MRSIAILPRPSLLTSAVVAMSVATGLAVGIVAAGLAVAAQSLGKR